MFRAGMNSKTLSPELEKRQKMCHRILRKHEDILNAHEKKVLGRKTIVAGTSFLLSLAALPQTALALIRYYNPTRSVRCKNRLLYSTLASATMFSLMGMSVNLLKDQLDQYSDKYLSHLSNEELSKFDKFYQMKKQQLRGSKVE